MRNYAVARGKMEARVAITGDQRDIRPCAPSSPHQTPVVAPTQHCGGQWGKCHLSTPPKCNKEKKTTQQQTSAPTSMRSPMRLHSPPSRCPAPQRSKREWMTADKSVVKFARGMPWDTSRRR